MRRDAISVEQIDTDNLAGANGLRAVGGRRVLTASTVRRVNPIGMHQPPANRFDLSEQVRMRILLRSCLLAVRARWCGCRSGDLSMGELKLKKPIAAIESDDGLPIGRVLELFGGLARRARFHLPPHPDFRHGPLLRKKRSSAFLLLPQPGFCPAALLFSLSLIGVMT